MAKKQIFLCILNASFCSITHIEWLKTKKLFLTSKKNTQKLFYEQ